MITQALLELVVLLLSVLFAIVGQLLSVLGVSLTDFVSSIRSFSLWAFSTASYFFNPSMLKAAVLFVPALYTARLTLYGVRYAISLIRGSGS